MPFSLKRLNSNIYAATLYAVALALIALWLTRFGFVLYNHDTVGAPDLAETLRLSMHGLRFDLTAVLYFNALFIAMRILPFGFVYAKVWVRITDWVYGICNGLMLAINIGDIPYYRFTGARLRWVNVLNITTDSGIGNIVMQYVGSYIGFFVAGALAIALLIFLYLRIRPARPPRKINVYIRVALFVVLGGLCALGMRGRVGSGIPLAIPDAAFVVKTPPQINVVLNSPFCILRSLNVKRSNYEARHDFFTSDELTSLRQTYHTAAPDASIDRRNIVIIIIESGGAEWIDNLAVSGREPGRGLMPFVDSLSRISRVYEHVLACGRVSAGGATAVMCGFPAFEPFYFMLSPYNKNVLDSPARLLADKGWDTTFYYGCKHGSFNIDQTAFASGYSRIIDREAYGNDADFDGVWGIFDYPMAEYAAEDMSSLSQPFIATWFTVSAHGPFSLPKDWDTTVFRHPEASPERGLEYTDQAIRHFFEVARTQPWYDNTTFIITADHGNRDFKGTPFDSDYIRNHIPLIVYTPDGSVAPDRISDRVISQHDVAGVVLRAVNYDAPYISLAAEVDAPDYDGYGIVRTDGGRYFIVGPAMSIYVSPDLSAIEEVYDTAADPTQQAAVEAYDSAEAGRMLTWTRAFMQDYAARLNDDRLSVKNTGK